MDPDIGPSPLHGQGCVPYLGRPDDIDLVNQLSNDRARLFVPGRHRTSSVEAVRAWRGPTVGAHSLQRNKEVRKVPSEPVIVGHPADRRRFTLEPFVDGPRPRETETRPTFGERARDRDR